MHRTYIFPFEHCAWLCAQEKALVLLGYFGEVGCQGFESGSLQTPVRQVSLLLLLPFVPHTSDDLNLLLVTQFSRPALSPPPSPGLGGPLAGPCWRICFIFIRSSADSRGRKRTASSSCAQSPRHSQRCPKE